MLVPFTRELDFRTERRFGATLGAAFEFIAAQFKPLFRCLAYFVLPTLMVFAVGMGLLIQGYYRLFAGAQPLGTSAYWGLSVGLLSFFVSLLLLTSTVYAFMRVRLTNAPDQPVQPRQVWVLLRQRIGRVLLSCVLLFAITLGASIVLGMLTSMAGLVLGPVLSLLALLPTLWFYTALALYFPVLWLEDAGAGASLTRSFHLIGGRWWFSLGIYLLSSALALFLSNVLAIPFYIMGIMQALHASLGIPPQIWVAMAMVFYAIGFSFVMVLPLVAMGFQYFNLVEHKESPGFYLLLHSLGAMPHTTAQNQELRPEEEGDY